ncbi:MAG: hypothetical protein LBJ63_12020 [Prevotellaceae bacterium]|jgi:DNA-binding Lrp family transcriptional regulator|nr:hypothetical protein [Prevotellaceae bacterium]
MSKLNTETINRISTVPRFRSELAIAIGLSEYAIIYNLKHNNDNGILTKITALRCMCDLLGYKDINQCLDLISNEE